MRYSTLTKIINYIVNRSAELKNRFTDARDAPVEFACVFCQTEDEYKKFSGEIERLGKVVQDTESGFTYFLNEPIKTVSGPLRLVKTRRPDSQRQERGDADFNTNYPKFKKIYKGKPGFELIKRESFEMLRLSDPKFDVMTCFSSVPMSKYLRINF